MTPTLRPYQERSLEDLRHLLRQGARRILFEASVGFGKSLAIQKVAHGYAGAGHNVLVLSNRTAVVDQLRDRAAGNERIIASTVQGIVRRLDRIPVPAVVIVDEIHMGGAAAQYASVFAAFPDAIVIGFTGTPTAELYDLLPAVVTGESAAALTEAGWLSPLLYRVPERLDLSRIRVINGDYDQEQLREELERRAICGSAIRSYADYCVNEPTLAFTINVKHALSVQEEFAAAGFPSEVLIGADKKDEVARKVAALRAGGLVISVDKVSAGFDLPDLRHLLALRPTKSPQLWTQMLGRAARTAPGKPCGMVHDHTGGNTMLLGTLTETRDWKTGDRVSTERQTEDGDRLSVRHCEQCYRVFETGPTSCPSCGADLGKDLRISKREAIELRERTAAEVEEERLRLGLLKKDRVRSAETYADLLALERELGHAKGWAGVQWKLRKQGYWRQRRAG